MNTDSNITRPHQGQPVLTIGTPLTEARAAMVMVHGRGATAESILSLADELHHPGFAYLAPQAAGNSWYPYSFLAPIERNEPWLTSALALLDEVLEALIQAGMPRERTILLGFSQGACLCLEYVARHPRPFGGVVGLSGGVIGPDGTPRDVPTDSPLAGTPVFLGCSDVDSHIPLSRVHESTTLLREMGASVTERIYPNMGHTVNRDELEVVRQMMAALPQP
jgi:predicted esterase